MTETGPAAIEVPRPALSTAPLTPAEVSLAIDMPEPAELAALLAPGFGGTFAVEGEPGSGKSTLLSIVIAERKVAVARLRVTRETTILEAVQEILLHLSHEALRLAEQMPHPEQPPQGWQDRAKAQLFAPMYWTVRGLRALSVSLFSFIAIAFIVAQIAPDLFERPLEALAGLVGDLLGIPPLWVWPIVAVAVIAIVLSLRLQKRLDRQVDEAVSDLSGWIPDERIRNWLGVDPESDADILATNARRLSEAVTEAQLVRAARRDSGTLFTRLGMPQWQAAPTLDGDGARIATIAGAMAELSGLQARIARASRSIVVLEGAAAGDLAPDLAFIGALPGCDLLVEGAAASADATVTVRPWPDARLREMLLRRAPDVDATRIARAIDGAKGNPREAIRALRLSLATERGKTPTM